MKPPPKNTAQRTLAQLVGAVGIGLCGLGITVVNHAFGSSFRVPRPPFRVTRGGVMAERKGERKAFLLRVDPKVLDAIQRWADDDLRSLNGQIEYLLRRVLHESGRLKPETPAQEPPQDK